MDSEKCPRCGHSTPAPAKFCPDCGFNVAAASQDTGSMAVITESAAQLPADVGALIITGGGTLGERYLLIGPEGASVSVGRAADTDIFLDDVTVSRHHGDFRRVQGQWCFYDSGSLNGTYVNGRRIDTAELADNDVIVIGKFRFLFRDGAAL